jgi:hypothetical protein
MLSADERARLEARLLKYEDAMDELLIGRRVQVVEDSGEKLSYTPADVTKLRTAITETKMRLSGRGPFIPRF